MGYDRRLPWKGWRAELIAAIIGWSIWFAAIVAAGYLFSGRWPWL